MSTQRVAIGGLYQESHSFSPAPATMDEFEACLLVRDEAVFDRLSGMNHEVAGALDVLGECECVPLIYGATAASGMPLRRACYEQLKSEYLDRVRAAMPLDGVVMTMHGAMVAEHIDDATGDLIEGVRRIVGPDIPITVSLDLHANVTRRMAEHADALVGYHTAPHVDQKDTGVRAAVVMKHLLAGGRVAQAFCPIPMIVPAENGQTTVGPYAEVMGQALRLEARDDVLSASVFSVQPWLDLKEVGCAVIVVTNGNTALATNQASSLAKRLWDRKHEFVPDLTPYQDAIDHALAAEQGPFIFSDSADAPSSGAPGDSTILLKALLEREVNKPVYLNIVDPGAVARATEIGVGNTGTVTVGACYSEQFYAPVTFDGRVRTLFDGTFTFKGPGFHGVTFEMGTTAVWTIDGIHLVAMERGVLQWDPELYRCVGLEPADASICVVKSPAAFRAAYEPIAHQIVNIDAPGVCSPNLASFPWERVSRPIHPIDTFDTDPTLQASIL